MPAHTTSFEEFKASRVFCADLGDKLDDASLMGATGYLYLGVLYIEIANESWPDKDALNRGAFCMTIGNGSVITDDLGHCEHKLYEFACGDGYCEASKPDPSRFTLSDEVVQAALDAAVLVVQQHLGVNAGDVAGVHFSGEAGEKFGVIMQEYATTEKHYDDTDPGDEPEDLNTGWSEGDDEAAKSEEGAE